VGNYEIEFGIAYATILISIVVAGFAVKGFGGLVVGFICLVGGGYLGVAIAYFFRGRGPCKSSIFTLGALTGVFMFNFVSTATITIAAVITAIVSAIAFRLMLPSHEASVEALAKSGPKCK
jgi:NADPH-dependent 2,4-dienoyl-CoA reductase/sulfur reductase-like enzyme